MVAHTYISLPPLVDNWFQVLFHSPPGVLFTFPSRYLFTIGHQEVFSLTRWSGQILAEFHVLHDTWEYTTYALYLFTYGTVTLFGCPFQDIQLKYNALSKDQHDLDRISRYPFSTTHAGLTC